MARQRSGTGVPRRPGADRRLKPGKRTASSKRWLDRQLKDPYVHEARRRGYRSRAAFKLMEMDDRFRLLKPGMRVVDLGAAPGGWTQVAVERTKGGTVVALDRLPIDPIPGAVVLTGDFLEETTQEQVRDALGGRAGLVLSDLAPDTTGHATTDHLRIMAMAETVLDFAATVLAPGGSLVLKVFRGGAEPELLARLKREFASVKHVKPPASRKESVEIYVVATGYRGASVPQS
jgi:23S rRNA (uridine2552-2'-O)-methyltransferase